MEKFVTTKAEYQFDPELDKYVLGSKEGYWYDGDWSLADGGPTPLPAPDPREIARTDAEFNRIDQNAPFGSLSFSGPNRNTANLELTPELQGLFDQRLQGDSQVLGSVLQRLGTLNNNPIDLSQFGPIQSDIDTSNVNFQGPDLSGVPSIPQDIEQFRGDVEQSVFDRGRALLDPVFQDEGRRLEQRLANQGLPSSGEAFDRDVTRFGQRKDRAFVDLANAATITGGSEASRALGDVLASQGQGFGQAITGGDAQNRSSFLNQGLEQQQLLNRNAGRGQGLGEDLAIRGNQLGEISNLLGFQQTPTPSLQDFFGPGQVDTTGAFALNQQAQQNAFLADQSQSNALLGGLFGLGGSVLGGPIGGAIGSSIFGGKPTPQIPQQAGFFPGANAFGLG